MPLLLDLRYAIALLVFSLLATFSAPPAQCQTAPAVPREAPTAGVALLSVALYTAQANYQEASDSTKSTLATGILTSRLNELLGEQLVPVSRVADVAGSTGARATAGDQACGVIVACARFVGKTVKAPWVVMAKVSKTSNLIWLFTGQLIRVSTGEVVLDDSTELKGEPDRMVQAGARIFAERVARTVRNGGVTTNFPSVN